MRQQTLSEAATEQVSAGDLAGGVPSGKVAGALAGDAEWGVGGRLDVVGHEGGLRRAKGRKNLSMIPAPPSGEPRHMNILGLGPFRQQSSATMRLAIHRPCALCGGSVRCVLPTAVALLCRRSIVLRRPSLARTAAGGERIVWWWRCEQCVCVIVQVCCDTDYQGLL